MSGTLTLEGLDDLISALRQLPEELNAQAGDIVELAARTTGADLIANYPVRTGNLKGHVTVTVDRTPGGTTATVRSGSPHAGIYERGTGPRRSNYGNRGVMPEAPLEKRLVPRAMRARARMTAQLVGLVREAGFEVRSD